MGRLFSSLDHRRERPARTNQERKDTLTGFDGKTRGAGEINRVHHGIHREADITRQLDYNLQRALEGLLRREVWAVVEEDEGKPPVPFCEARSPAFAGESLSMRE